MIHVATLDDPRVQDYRLTARPDELRARGLFIAEGRLVVERLLASERFAVQSVLVTAPAHRSMATVLEATSAPVYVVPQTVMNELVGFNIHRGCLALAERPAHVGFDAGALQELSRLMVLEGISNPDNIGGLFRNAAAFGVEHVLLADGCGDPLYRKAIRTSMGASLLVPFSDGVSWPEAARTLRRGGFCLIALTPAADALPLGRVTRPARAALLLGAEGAGLSREALEAADLRVRIPMRPTIDSLNVATAAAVALHHLFACDPV